MPLYVLEIEGGAALSINAHDDEGAEILAYYALDGEMPPSAVVRLTTEDGRRVVIDTTVGEMSASAKIRTRGSG